MPTIRERSPLIAAENAYHLGALAIMADCESRS